MFCVACERVTRSTPCEHCGSDPLLDGRYCLQALLGGSRYSRTWRALQGQHPVVVQELPLGFADPNEIRDLVQHEVRQLRRLDHPGVPRYYDGLVSRLGNRYALFLVQEHIPGATLAQLIEKEPFDLDDVLAMVEDVSRTLDYLHGLSPPVLHRNIKPANILRRDDGEGYVLIDFGGVRDVLRDLDGRPGAGADGYSAPEQLRGRVAPSSDIYALGVTALRLLTGREPADLKGPDGQLQWAQHVNVGASVQWLLQGMVDPDPSRRVRSIRELSLRLKTVRGPKKKKRRDRTGSSGSSTPAGLPEPLGGGQALDASRLQRVPGHPGRNMSLEDAETELYQGDERSLGELGDMDEPEDTFLGLPAGMEDELEGPVEVNAGEVLNRHRRRTPPPRDPPAGRDDADLWALRNQTLVAEDSDFSEPPPDPGDAPVITQRPSRKKVQRLSDLGRPRRAHTPEPTEPPEPPAPPLREPPPPREPLREPPPPREPLREPPPPREPLREQPPPREPLREPPTLREPPALREPPCRGIPPPRAAPPPASRCRCATRRRLGRR
ncbi:MAG: serine/threonine protein kinase [Alphaproteobacteria bacterium]|nr:serine/threonine protein kinase [Alphaproteobacteria bacterium]